MKLIEAIETIFEQNDDQTIWVQSGAPVSSESEVILAFETDAGGPPENVEGFEYLLEVFVTQDLIIGLVGSQSVPASELLSITNRVIQYAENDA